MNLRIQENCEGINWDEVRECLKRAGLGYHRPESHQKAFENSYAVVFVFYGESLVGLGRAISDGVYQAAIYDVAVVPEFQGRGIGTEIMERILKKISHCNVILYANIGKEGFYTRWGFRPLRTAMARFLRPEIMEQKGFIG
ncbi:MAG: GNAT family N-acetyltransferase [Syntrophales bacterium]|nr:GNAT family N-acetyltransferase [Syntrophales bacterium]